MDIKDLRNKIDLIDEELVRLLNERTNVALKIGKSKQKIGQDIYAPSREEEVFDRAKALNQGPLTDLSLFAIYREIMSASLSVQQKDETLIAYLGPKATFTHMAALAYFGSSVKYRAYNNITDVFRATENGRADYGVIPVENSTEGVVTHTLDQFVDTQLKICAEIYMPVEHHLLLARSGSHIERIYSHPQVFGQCRKWLSGHMPNVELIPTSSTARAAEIAASEEFSAAIAGLLSADIYGLKFISRDIQDISGNTTRFIVIGKTFPKSTGNDRTTFLMSIKHCVGTLCETLKIIQESRLNLTRIESRPYKTKAWEYYFFVDIDGHAEDEVVKKALNKLSEKCIFLKILGSYPRAEIERPSNAS